MGNYVEIQRITINEAIRVIEKAERKGLISRYAAEMIIMDLWQETDPNKYHRPTTKG